MATQVLISNRPTLQAAFLGCDDRLCLHLSLNKLKAPYKWKKQMIQLAEHQTSTALVQILANAS